MIYLSQVFRDVKPESENENENMQPVCLSIVARMKMQVKEKAATATPRIIDYTLLTVAMDWQT